MSRKKKIFIIFHLCFAFAFLFWLLIQPSAKEIISQKTELALYEMVLEHDEFLNELPLEEQLKLTDGYEEAQNKQRPSIFHQIGHLFFVETPPFALAWLFFSIVICLMLLFEIEGSTIAVWLLPLLVLGYAYFLYSTPPIEQNSLFPSEEYVLTKYVAANELKTMNYRESLLLGWHRYLIQEWTNQVPSYEVDEFKDQLDRGLFAFNVARLNWSLEGKPDEVIRAGFMAPPSILRVMCYLIWNMFLAWYISRKKNLLSSEAVSSPSS
ncbi:MAG: hypothetical protein S4CHLAM123_10210 [Chlamydiales bacterium]|nr:hypothetical protein [Chlamydiales bacterium]